MKTDGAWKHFLAAGVLATLLYVVLFFIIERSRSAKGAWTVEMHAENDQTATLVINQSTLGIRNARLSLPGPVPASFQPGEVVFNEPRPFPYPLPFGTCVFADLTFLPGTVVIDTLGQRIELLPSRLIVNSQAYPWAVATNQVFRPSPPLSTSRPPEK